MSGRDQWTNFWTRLRRGPWPEVTLRRLVLALEEVARVLRAQEDLAGLLIVGSYARGDFARKSAVDIVVLLGDGTGADPDGARRITAVLQEAESRAHLPMRLRPLLVHAADAERLTPALLHDLWRDGVILYGEAAVLALLRPSNLEPWAVVRFWRGGRASERVRLSRRLHGAGDREGIVRLPARTLGQGVLFVPALLEPLVRRALEEEGASYEIFRVWREA